MRAFALGCGADAPQLEPNPAQTATPRATPPVTTEPLHLRFVINRSLRSASSLGQLLPASLFRPGVWPKIGRPFGRWGWSPRDFHFGCNPKGTFGCFVRVAPS